MNSNKNYMILTDANFQKEALESMQPVLVEFGAAWCGSCHMIAPAIEELAADFEGQIKITKLAIDDNERVAKEYGIRVPLTLLFFKNGQVIDHINGPVPKRAMQDKLNALLQNGVSNEKVQICDKP